MSVETVFIVVAESTGFNSVYKNNCDAIVASNSLTDKSKYKDNFQIIPYVIFNKTDEIALSEYVYVLLSVNQNLPLFITKNIEEFNLIQQFYLNIYLTYPEPAEFWKHHL